MEKFKLKIDVKGDLFKKMRKIKNGHI